MDTTQKVIKALKDIDLKKKNLSEIFEEASVDFMRDNQQYPEKVEG